jgi:hypothetical protein
LLGDGKAANIKTCAGAGDAYLTVGALRRDDWLEQLPLPVYEHGVVLLSSEPVRKRDRAAADTRE